MTLQWWLFNDDLFRTNFLEDLSMMPSMLFHFAECWFSYAAKIINSGFWFQIEGTNTSNSALCHIGCRCCQVYCSNCQVCYCCCCCHVPFFGFNKLQQPTQQSLQRNIKIKSTVREQVYIKYIYANFFLLFVLTFQCWSYNNDLSTKFFHRILIFSSRQEIIIGAFCF